MALGKSQSGDLLDASGPSDGARNVMQYEIRNELPAAPRPRKLASMNVLRICTLALLLAGLVRAEEPVAVNAYFSKDDTHWPAVEKTLDAAAAKYPRLRLSKIDIDTPVGYKLLRALESLNDTQTGDLTVTVEHVTLTSKGERRDVETYLPSAIERALGLAGIKGKKPADAAAYAAEIFGAGATATPDGAADPDRDDAFFRVKLNGQIAGWVVNAYRKIECPVCSDAQFLIAVKSPTLTIVDMRPVRELEIRGVKADDAVTRPFLAQVKGRAASDGEKRIDVLSGATKTTTAYQIAINEVLQELQKREKQ